MQNSEYDRDQIKEVRDPFELPEEEAIAAVVAAAPSRFGDLIEFLTGLRECDIKAFLATAQAFHKELKTNSGLAHTGIALDEIDAVRG